MFPVSVGSLKILPFELYTETFEPLFEGKCPYTVMVKNGQKSSPWRFIRRCSSQYLKESVPVPSWSKRLYKAEMKTEFSNRFLKSHKVTDPFGATVLIA